jgi:hypothetical protein
MKDKLRVRQARLDSLQKRCQLPANTAYKLSVGQQGCIYFLFMEKKDEKESMDEHCIAHIRNRRRGLRTVAHAGQAYVYLKRFGKQSLL